MGTSNSSVVKALVGNGILTIIKSGAWFVTGSSAMLAEAIHSFADTGNQALLLIGIKTSQSPGNKRHPFGFGKDRFVWALLSAAGIFFLGCGVTITHGYHALTSHEKSAPPGMLTWIVLGIALVIDGVVLAAAFKELNDQRRGKPWLHFLRTSDDTTTIAVLFEDGAAALGVLMAGAGIFATHYLGLWWADGAATIAIGVLLGIIAVFLGRQNRAYLIDRAIGADVQARILHVICGRHEAVTNIFEVRTRVVGAGKLSFAAEIEFDGKVISDHVQKRMDLEKELTKLKTPEDLDRLLDEHARIVVEELGHEIDRIEQEVREAVPGATFIAIEPD